MKVRSGRGSILPLSPPSPPRPVGRPHSATLRAAYTEAHQSTHTRPSGHTGGKDRKLETGEKKTTKTQNMKQSEGRTDSTP